ncbi:hypothetical protein HJC23_001713 [Cyclotella cryptica]|uniref:RNase H type-1 domain-containing protein n=1 Tax=Cyclotella cryptica TaxID=29204 RepID=A0ABD3NSX7_9STRA
MTYDATSGNKIWTGRRFIPVYSHHGKEKISRNLADYIALADGLKIMTTLMNKDSLPSSSNIEIQTCNRCIAKQLNNEYKAVGGLEPWYAKVKKLMDNFSGVTVARIPALQCANVKNESKLAVEEQKSCDNYTAAIRGDSNSDEKNIDRTNGSITASVSSEKVYILRFDGGCRGNPGIAGCGMALFDSEDGSEIWSGCQYLGEQRTYNMAEYTGLITGLRCALSLGVRKIVVQGDSMLIFRQIDGKDKVKSSILKQFYFEALALKKKFTVFTMVHIEREKNKRADELANEAMDTKCSRVSI